MAKRGGGQANGAEEPQPRELLAEGVPPQNLDAERMVLGSVLRTHECMNELVKRLDKPEYFYNAQHQKIYAAMLAMHGEGEPIDAITIGEHLTRKKQLKEVGGPLLVELFESVLTSANVMHYAEIVWEKAVRRHLIGTATEVLRESYDQSRHADELLADAEKKIFAMLQDRSSTDAVQIEKVLTSVFTRIQVRADGRGVGGVPSGFRDLDELTNGWQKSELIILAARPSVGKTAFALNMADAAAVTNQVPTLIVSLEMSELELAERMLCSRARVNSHHLRRGRVSSEDMNKLIHAASELSASPVYIDDKPGQTMLRIAATARRLKLRHNLGLIIVDYLQLIEPDDKRVGRVEQIGAISRRLKTLSRELDVPVIALSQLNRAVETREGHRPRMADLRESGSIEQDADVVAMLHREDAFNPDTEKKGEADLILCKQRNGPVGDVKLTFLKELTRFQDYAADVGAFGDPNDGDF